MELGTQARGNQLFILTHKMFERITMPRDPFPQDPDAWNHIDDEQEEPKEQPKDPKLSILSVGDILKWEDDPRDLVLANGYMSKGDLCAWCGPPGIGKSRLILQLAICMILGNKFLDWETNGMELKWLFLQSENSMRRLKADLLAMTQTLTSVQMGMLAEHLFVHGLVLDTDGDLNLMHAINRQRIIDVLAERDYGVVVGDPLSGFSTDDLNTDKAMLALAKDFCSIVKKGNPKRIPFLIHHARTGKAGAASTTGMDRSSHGRQSKALYGITRAMVNLAPYEEENNESVVIASGKCNNAKEFEEFVAELDTDRMWYSIKEDADVEEWKEKIKSNGSGGGRPHKGDRKDFLSCFSTFTPLTVKDAFFAYENKTAKSKRVSFSKFKEWKAECIGLDEIYESEQKTKYLLR